MGLSLSLTRTEENAPLPPPPSQIGRNLVRAEMLHVNPFTGSPTANNVMRLRLVPIWRNILSDCMQTRINDVLGREASKRARGI